MSNLSRKLMMGAAGAAGEKVYVEDVFSTYLYTGTGSTQTITNGIDLSGEGGLVWTKQRSTESPVGNHYLYDTTRGAQNTLSSNTTDASYTRSGSVTSFSSSGFSVGNDSIINGSGRNVASWTFRKAEKFFDVVTYTGDGVFSRQVNHSLAATPGLVLIKRTDSTGNWVAVCRRDAATLDVMYLNQNGTSLSGLVNYPSSSAYVSPTTFGPEWFTVAGVSASDVNANGGTYVAYLFAHDAGGFGDAGTDNVISCGSYTTDGSGNATITLGWEPQWVLVKKSSTAAGNTTDDWFLYDTMRGAGVDSAQKLAANTSSAESANSSFRNISATGFSWSGSASVTYIYIAIRRGPMRVPTLGTSVYNAIVRNGTGAVANITGVGFPPDLITVKNRNAGYDNNWVDKLRGALPILASSKTAAEVTDTTTAVTAFDQDGVTLGDNNVGTYGGAVNFSTVQSYVNWFFRRAPSFFDEVCYTGTGANTTFTHNLGVVPELMIVKGRTNTGYWTVYESSVGATKYLLLNDTGTPSTNSAIWNNTTPTSTVFSVGTQAFVNGSGVTYVAYLFATCPGVSKVGSYTGTGTTLSIDCGFTAGARFVLIKRTDDTGDWYVWDTARGIVSGDDPYLLLNSAAAEVTNTDYIDPLSSGFQISSTAPAAINASGGSFIFLAIA